MNADQTMAYFQAQALTWGPRVLIAIVILIITWVVARAVKALVHRSAHSIPAVKRHAERSQGKPVGEQLGTIAGLIIWLVGIMAALQFLGIAQILAPINTLTTEIFAFVPRLIGAGVIFFVGLIVARIVRELVETLVNAANLEGITGRLGMTGTAETMTGAAASGVPAGTARGNIARAAGIIVFALIIIPVAIAALQVLGIAAISVPAIAMLNEIMAAIPRILSAGLWLGIAYLAGRLLKSVIEGILPATGFDAAIRSTGIVPASVTPSQIVGNIAMIVIILSASIEAARQLGGVTIAAFLAEITALGGRVLFGSLIIVAGLFLARIITNLMNSTEDSLGRTLVRYGIIALATAMGLRFMGLANEIVILAFGLILGSAAVASAIAFGLGGRRPAERLLDAHVDRAIAASTGSGASEQQLSRPQRRKAPSTSGEL